MLLAGRKRSGSQKIPTSREEEGPPRSWSKGFWGRRGFAPPPPPPLPLLLTSSTREESADALAARRASKKGGGEEFASSKPSAAAELPRRSLEQAKTRTTRKAIPGGSRSGRREALFFGGEKGERKEGKKREWKKKRAENLPILFIFPASIFQGKK